MVKQKAKKSGYLYIITNSAFPGFVKVGCTENISSRLRTYQTADPKRSYRMEFFIEHPDCYNAERRICELMKPFAKSRKNEWYEVNTHIAISILQDSLDEYNNPPPSLI